MSLEQAHGAGGSAGAVPNRYETCFGCGRLRDDGLRIHPGRVSDGLVACVVAPRGRGGRGMGVGGSGPHQWLGPQPIGDMSLVTGRLTGGLLDSEPIDPVGPYIAVGAQTEQPRSQAHLRGGPVHPGRSPGRRCARDVAAGLIGPCAQSPRGEVCFMIRYVVSAAWSPACWQPSCPARRRKPTTSRSLLQQLRESSRARCSRPGCPGVAVAVVHNDQVIYSQGSGAQHEDQRAGQNRHRLSSWPGLQAVLARPSWQRRSATRTRSGPPSDHEVPAPVHPGVNTYVTKNVTVADMYPPPEDSLPGSVGNDLRSLWFRPQSDHRACDTSCCRRSRSP